MNNSRHSKSRAKFVNDLSFAGIQNGDNLVSAICASGTDTAKAWIDAES